MFSINVKYKLHLTLPFVVHKFKLYKIVGTISHGDSFLCPSTLRLSDNLTGKIHLPFFVQPRHYAQTFHARKRAAPLFLPQKRTTPSSAQLCSSIWPRLTICQTETRNAETLLIQLTVILSARERTAQRSR